MRVTAVFVAGLLCAASPLHAQEAIESPDFVFVKRGPLTAILKSSMPYQIGATRDSIVVPRGFVTDFASIPRVLWSRLSPVDDYKLAAVVHDYLYWFQPCTREESDNLLFIAMTEDSVSSADRRFVYEGVRLGGAAAWNANRAARDQGEIKIVPDSAGFPFRPARLETWQQFATRLRARGIQGSPGRMPRQKYCDYGKRRVVP